MSGIVGVHQEAGQHAGSNQFAQRSQSLGRAVHQAAQQRPRQPLLQRRQQHLLLPVVRHMPAELEFQDVGGHRRSQQALLQYLGRFGGSDHLVPLPALRTGIRVAHVLGDVDFRRLDLELFADMFLNHDPFLSAAATGEFLIGERMIDAPAFQELREHDPFPAATQWIPVGCGPRRFVRRAVGLTLSRCSLISVGGGRISRRRSGRLGLKQGRLVRIGNIAFTPRRPEGLLQQRDLLGGLDELLVVSREGRLQLRVLLSQLGNLTLVSGHAVGKMVTSVFHACIDAPAREFVWRIPKLF
jgi:hypothetical protein